MKAIILCVSLTACWLTLATPASPTPSIVTQPRSQPLQGCWHQTDAHGQYRASGLTLVFDGSSLTMSRPSGETDIVRFSTDTDTSPSSIDLDLPEGRARGIYEVIDGTLRLTLVEDGSERPTEFRTNRVAEFRRLPAR